MRALCEDNMQAENFHFLTVKREFEILLAGTNYN